MVEQTVVARQVLLMTEKLDVAASSIPLSSLNNPSLDGK
jgi:hypothetical protein